MGGAASGKYEVKSCGKAHAWCAVCRPEQAAAQRKPKAPLRSAVRPCRNCGRCDACLGIVVPEGMKFCRTCREIKPVSEFFRRLPDGRPRNICRQCQRGGYVMTRCEGCGRSFGRWSDGRTLCAGCKPKDVMPCAQCGAEFARSMSVRLYCSRECKRVALAARRAAGYQEIRRGALLAYGGPEPACACCGEREPRFLAIDHINGGGHKQLRELGGGGYWSWLRKNNYPEGFQVLCHNCNMGRQLNGGTCPHKAAA